VICGRRERKRKELGKIRNLIRGKLKSGELKQRAFVLEIPAFLFLEVSPLRTFSSLHPRRYPNSTLPYPLPLPLLLSLLSRF